MSSQPLSQSRTAVLGFRDGLGDRFVTTDRSSGERLEVLRLRAEFMKVPAFEFAVRERTARLASFRHSAFVRVRRVDRLPQPSGRLAIVSDGVEGARLSDILHVAEQRNLALDINAALCLLRQIVPAVGQLHQNAREVSHGALAAERIVVTPQARIVIVEHVLGSALEQLHLSRDTLWRELRVAMPSSAGPACFDQRADLTQVGMIALGLFLARPIRSDEYPGRVRDLVDAATEASVFGDRQPLSAGLRDWLRKTLQLDPRGSFASARETLEALDRVLADGTSYVTAPVAIEAFLARLEQSERPAPGAAEAAEDDRQPQEAANEASSASRVAAPTPPQASGSPEPDDRLVDPAAPASHDPKAAGGEGAGGGDEAPRWPQKIRAVRPASGRLLVAPEDADDADDAGAAEEQGASAGPRAGEGAESPEPARTPRRFGRWQRVAVAGIVLVALTQGVLMATRSYRERETTVAPPPAVAASTLIVETTPPGAEVFIDGEAYGLTPVTLSIDPGAHILELRGRGAPRVVPFKLAAGEQVRHHLDLPHVEETGSLQVRTDPPGARVTVGAVVYGQSPLTIGDLAPGEHAVVLEGEAGQVRETVTIEAGMTASLVVPLRSPAGPVSGWLSVTAPFEMLIYQDGGLVGTSSNPRMILPAGRHELEIVNESIGYLDQRSVQVQPGRVTSLAVQLPTGRLHLNAQPWAEVWLDGEMVGETPIGNVEVPIGPHEIVFRHPELGERRHAVIVRPNEPAHVSIDMRR